MRLRFFRQLLFVLVFIFIFAGCKGAYTQAGAAGGLTEGMIAGGSGGGSETATCTEKTVRICEINCMTAGDNGYLACLEPSASGTCNEEVATNLETCMSSCDGYNACLAVCETAFSDCLNGGGFQTCEQTYYGCTLKCRQSALADLSQ